MQYAENTGGGSLTIRDMRVGPNSVQIVRNRGPGSMNVNEMVGGDRCFQACGSFDDGELLKMLDIWGAMKRHRPHRTEYSQLATYLQPAGIAETARGLLRVAAQMRSAVIFGTLVHQNEGWDVTFDDNQRQAKNMERAELDMETLVCAEVLVGVLAHLLESCMGQYAICPAWLSARRGRIFGTQGRRPKATVEEMALLIMEAPICLVRHDVWVDSNLVLLWQQARDSGREGRMPELAMFLALQSELPGEADENE